MFLTYNVLLLYVTHAVSLTFDTLTLNVIGCHVIKLGTKFEQNRTVRGCCVEQCFSENLQCVLARKCQTTAVLLFLPSCIHFATHEETVILEENVM